MKKLILFLIAGFLLQASAFAEANWVTDLPAAQSAARKDHKLVLVNFTGSDWCGWCKRLQKEVFSTKEFADYAKQNLELVEIDFPARKKQSDALKKANEALKQRYQADGFPTIVVLNSEGKEIWRQPGYLEGGPKVWLAKLESLKKK